MAISALLSGSFVVRTLLATGCIMSVALAGCAPGTGGADPPAATSPDASSGDDFDLAEFTAAVNVPKFEQLYWQLVQRSLEARGHNAQTEAVSS